MSMPGDRVLLISSLPKGACLPLDCGLAGFSIAQFSNRLKKKIKALAINFKFIWLFFIVRVGGILLSPAFSVQEKKPEALSTTLPFYLTF